MMATLASIYKSINSHAAMFDSYKPLFDSLMRNHHFIEQFRRDNEIISGLYCNTIRTYLAERGWYVGPLLNGNQLATLARGIEQGGCDSEIEIFLADHVRSELENIKRAALNQWPKRIKFLSDAFEAHRNGQHTLSIPAFLAQADGMAFEILDAYLFTNYSGKITVKAQEFIDANLSERTLMFSFAGILLEDSGLRTGTKKLDQRKQSGPPISPLNRHGVMHGIDSDYATEPNGLRAISLIALLTEVHNFKPSTDVK